MTPKVLLGLGLALSLMVQSPGTARMPDVYALAADGKFDDAAKLLAETLKADSWSVAARVASVVVNGVLKSEISAASARTYFRAAQEVAGGRVTAGIAGIDKAIAAEPKYAMYLSERGSWKYRARQTAAAIADYDAAIALDPRLAIAYYNRAVARISLREWDTAEADLTKSLELDPNDRESLLNRGNIKLQRKDAKAALADYDRAVSLSPTYVLGYYQRGLAKSGLGDVAGAVADYTKVISLNPNHAEAHDNRGLALMLKLNKPVEGCSDWKRACELGRCSNYNLAKTRNMCKV